MSRVGGEEFRSHFADWAGHNCANMDYLTRDQVVENINEDDIDGCDNRGFKKISNVDNSSLSAHFDLLAVRARPLGGNPCWGLVCV